MASDVPQMTKSQYDEFIKNLKGHDWWYQYADDKRAYAAGSASWGRISPVAKRYPEAKEALELTQMYNDSTRTDEDRLILNEELDKIRENLPE
jgi:hypothetical protein